MAIKWMKKGKRPGLVFKDVSIVKGFSKTNGEYYTIRFKGGCFDMMKHYSRVMVGYDENKVYFKPTEDIAGYKMVINDESSCVRITHNRDSDFLEAFSAVGNFVPAYEDEVYSITLEE